MSPQGLWGDGRKGEKQREGGERGEGGGGKKGEAGKGMWKWEVGGEK